MNSRQIVLLMLLSAGALQAAPLRQAQFTRIMNDVKLVPDQQSPVTAKIGDVVSGKTAVTTGVQSRAELRFEDNTITRLGANSVFSLDEGSRTVNLKQGTLLLQVPKQLGGANVRTAAITAAVTGTTVMIEYQPDGYVKLIVLEGQMDVFRNDKPSVFTTITAGDMLIMKPNGKEMPSPVQVDLKRLKKTSKLTNDKEFGPLGNQIHLQQADKDQTSRLNSGELQETSLVVRDNVVFTNTDKVVDLLPQVSGRSTVATTHITPVIPPGTKYGKPPLLGPAVVDNSTVINTDPRIVTAFDGTVASGPGRIYRPTVDQSIGNYLFKTPTDRVNVAFDTSPLFFDDLLAKQGTWATFNFEKLDVIGAPTITTTGGAKNLILASSSLLTLSDVDPNNPFSTAVGNWDLSASGLKNVAFIAGDIIDWQSGFAVTGTTQNVYLYTQNPGTSGAASTGDINLSAGGQTLVDLSDGMFTAYAARDVNLSSSDPANPPVVNAKVVNLEASRDVNIGSNATIAASDSIHIVANRGISITDSSQLRRLSMANPLQIEMVAGTGDITIAGASLMSGRVTIDGQQVTATANNGNISIQNTNISADVIKAHTLGANGRLLIGGTNLTSTQSIRLYAEGSNGMVEFVGNSSLSGPAAIAGKTVQVDRGVTVNVNDLNNFNVYADRQNFNGGSYGDFIHSRTPINFASDDTPGAHKHTFSSRPSF